MSTVTPELTCLALVISFAFVAAVIGIAHTIIRRFRHEARLRDIIRDDNWYPSLSLFQFVIWTSIIAFLYFGVYLTRIFGGYIGFPPTPPSNLLTLMGISVAVPVVSNGVSTFKYGATGKDTTLSPQEIIKNHPLSTMLEENNKPSLSRFQMFIWTWIGITIYLAIFFVMITKPGTLQAVENLHLPDIDPTLVLLMGLSQGAYVGGKLVASQSMEITKINPPKAKTGDTISVFGNKFGDKADTVLFNDTKTEQRVKMLPQGTGIVFWSDTRIDVIVPKGLQTGELSISVVVEGSTTLPKPEAKLVLN
jgi:hypothetical protein